MNSAARRTSAVEGQTAALCLLRSALDPPTPPPQPAAMRACSAIPAALAVSGVLHSFTLVIVSLKS